MTGLELGYLVLDILFIMWVGPLIIWYIIGYYLKIKKGNLCRVRDFIFPFPDKLYGEEIGGLPFLPPAGFFSLSIIIYKCLGPYICEKSEYIMKYIIMRYIIRLLNYRVIKKRGEEKVKEDSPKKSSLWVARDENGILCLYLGKPKKNRFSCIWEGTESTMGIYQDCLPDHCIPLWIDDEPIEVKLVKV